MTGITIQSADTDPTLEAEAAALDAAAEAAAGTPPLAGEKPERPENVPEKFWDAEKGAVNTEALLASYGELEKNRSTPADVDADEEAATAAVAATGLDMDSLQAEFTEHGELTQETLDTLAAKGITKDMVDSYVAGQTAQADAIRETLVGSIGGQEAYDAAIQWAADGLTDAEIDAFNGVLEGGDVNATKMAIENLHAKYVAENGSEPGRTLNGKNGDGGVGVYSSTEDLMKDMGNPEYETNPAFRAKVAAKLDRSNIM